MTYHGYGMTIPFDGTPLHAQREMVAELADRLVEIAPPGLNRVFYSDAGSTATEIALKMAFQYWRQRGGQHARRTSFVGLAEGSKGAEDPSLSWASTASGSGTEAGSRRGGAAGSSWARTGVARRDNKRAYLMRFGLAPAARRDNARGREPCPAPRAAGLTAPRSRSSPPRRNACNAPRRGRAV